MPMQRKGAATRASGEKTTRRKSRISYPFIRKEMMLRFGLVLTDAQIKRYATKHTVLKKDVPLDILDSIDRDLLIDFIVVDVLGKKWHWPLYGDPIGYGGKFFEKFYPKAKAKGIKLTEACEEAYAG